jgi:hypothetical protein
MQTLQVAFKIKRAYEAHPPGGDYQVCIHLIGVVKEAILHNQVVRIEEFSFHNKVIEIDFNPVDGGLRRGFVNKSTSVAKSIIYEKTRQCKLRNLQRKFLAYFW